MLAFILLGIVFTVARILGMFVDGVVPRVNFTTNMFIGLLLAPVAEELIFRGVIQHILIRKMGRDGIRRVGLISNPNLITSILFSGYHFVEHTPIVALGTIFPSLIFGILYEESRYKLRYPIAMHGFYNINMYIN